MKYKNIVKNTLSSKSFLQVNRNIMADLGDATATLVLSLIIDKHDYFEKRNELDGDSFFITKEVLMADLGLSEKVILNAEKRLIKKGYVTCRLKGLPRRKYYTIQWECIERTLQNVGTQPPECMLRDVQNDMGNDTKMNDTKVNETQMNENRGNKTRLDIWDEGDTLETSLHQVPSVSQSLRLAGVSTIDEYFDKW